MRIAFVLGLILFGTLPVLGIGASLLRAACRFCKGQAPTFPCAILIVFVAGLLTLPVGLGIQLGIWAVFEPRPHETAVFTLLCLTLSLLAGMAISAGVYTGMLPGITGRGPAPQWVEMLFRSSSPLPAVVDPKGGRPSDLR